MPLAPFRLRDLTHLSPVWDVRRPRRLGDIRAAVLHQCGFERKDANKRWALVHAHYVVHQSGLVSELHKITDQMRFGSGRANPYVITIEHEGNYPLDLRSGEPLYWAPDDFGRSVLANHPKQIDAARSLLAWLAKQVPGLQVGTHRQIEKQKSGCCGPDLWREVGQWSLNHLGMPEMPVDGGRPIPDEWRGPIAPSLRPYDGPLSVTG